MLTLIDKINQIEFPDRGNELLDALDALYKIGSNNLAESEKVMLRHDLDHFYHEKSRWLVHHTFAGGIIFLREPEIPYWEYVSISGDKYFYDADKDFYREGAHIIILCMLAE